MNNTIKKFPLVLQLVIIAVGGFVVALGVTAIQITPELTEIFLSTVIAVMFLYLFFSFAPFEKANMETKRTSLLLMITAIILTAVKIFLIIIGTKIMLAVIMLSLLIIILLTMITTLQRNH